MNKIAGIVKTHLADRWSWSILPWLILGISFCANLIIGGVSGDEIKTGGLASIYVYMFVLGIVSVGQTFPFLIGFGARRKDFFLGTTATILAIGVLSVILLLVLGWIESSTDYWGIGLQYFNVEYLTDGPLAERFWILFILMIHLFFSGFAIACIYRRFGRNGLYYFFGALGLILTCTFYLIGMNDKWKAVFDWFADVSVFELANGLFVATLLYVAFSYLMLRRATV